MASLFLDNLRSQTAAAHQALEAAPLAKALLHPQVTSTDYAAYLLTLYPFVAHFEQEVFPLLQSIIPDLEERRKMHLLQRDLLQLGVFEPQAPITISFSALYDHDVAKAMGGMYVLEGSVLGGKMITQHLLKQLGEGVGSYTSYMNAYGQHTGSKWKSFLETLTRFATPHNQQVIVQSAVNTFRKLKTIFTHPPLNTSVHGHPQHRQ